MLTDNIKNNLCDCALKLDKDNYTNKNELYKVLSTIKNSGEYLSKETLKYLFNSTQANYRLGLIYQEWKENGYKTADLSIKIKKIIVTILY